MTSTQTPIFYWVFVKVDSSCFPLAQIFVIIISNVTYKALFVKSSIFKETVLRQNLTHDINTIAWYSIFLTDISGLPIGLIFKGQESSLEDGTEKLPTGLR